MECVTAASGCKRGSTRAHALARHGVPRGGSAEAAHDLAPADVVAEIRARQPDPERAAAELVLRYADVSQMMISMKPCG